MARTTAEPDVVVLLQALARFASERVLAALDDGVRESDGYVFQHLIAGPQTSSALAERLGVSQQAVSKAVADMERRRLVSRRADPDDRRARPVELTDRAWSAIEGARVARARLADEFTSVLGDAGARRFERDVRRLIDHLGGAEVLARRSLRPPR